MTDDPHILGVVDAANGYDGLIEIMRRHIAEQGVAMWGIEQSIDAVAGLPDRYTSKLMAKPAIKKFGPISLGPFLGATGLRLYVAFVDKEAIKRLKKRQPGGSKIDPDAEPNAEPAAKRNGRKGRAKYLFFSAASQRSMTARIAACARWQKHRERERRLAARRQRRRDRMMEAGAKSRSSPASPSPAKASPRSPE
jgi:hypothetical protein